MSARRWTRPRTVVAGLLALGVAAYAMDQQGEDPMPEWMMMDTPADGYGPGNNDGENGGGYGDGQGSEFRQHRDPAGFELAYPAQWRVASNGQGEIAVRAPGANLGVAIRARPVAVGDDLAQWLERRFPASADELAGARVIERGSPDANIARATFRVGPEGSATLATAVAVRRGDIATVFTAFAPADRYQAELPRMSRVLESFRFVPAPASAARSGRAVAPPATRWVEPYEQAFSMEIPAGWSPEGGLLRRADGVRVAVQVSTPDRRAFIFFGDQAVPSYFVYPSQVALSLGNREGYPTGPNGPIMLRFLEAADMGQRLLQQRFGAVQVVRVRPRPDLVETLRRNPLLQGGASQLSAAELEFELPDGRLGVLALCTQGQPVQDLGGTWRVDHIHGFVAPRERAAETGMALARAVGTSRENPQWRAGESAHQARMSAQYQEFVSWSSARQREALEARWASDVARQEGRRDILGGTIQLRDPVSGERFETSGQDRYFYRVMDGSGRTAIGTDTDFSPAPDLDLRRLLRVGVDVP